MQAVHLICNAHLDPVWLWQWPEGAAEAIATFTTAADLCEEFPEFIFCHNEVILYQWVEEYAPDLFARIQKLVAQGKWHIMGGWFLQPDCNIPSGESFVRQIITGRQYFHDKFKAHPTTAINFDPFGHTSSLVQILRKSGYDSYLFCRPYRHNIKGPWLELPRNQFIWQGPDGSQILAHRACNSYQSLLGRVQEKIDAWAQEHSPDDYPLGLILWGVGNHGGGPSRRDLQTLRKLINESGERRFIHSTPEAYFQEIDHADQRLPVINSDLQPDMVGCYSAMSRIKRLHRRLENDLWFTEKILTHAWAYKLMEYPEHAMQDAQRDLLFSQFHDILPGTCIEPAAREAEQMMSHGLEILSRVRTKAFFALANSFARPAQPVYSASKLRQPARVHIHEPAQLDHTAGYVCTPAQVHYHGQYGTTVRRLHRPADDTIPMFVYNPHPFTVRTIVECEFQPLDMAWNNYLLPTVHDDNGQLPSQVEKEHSNVSLDHRKRMAFLADLKPASMHQFTCRLNYIPARPEQHTTPHNGMLQVTTDDLDVAINTRTGLLDRYTVNGATLLKPSAIRPIVMQDTADPWALATRSFRRRYGQFRLMSQQDADRFSPMVNTDMPPVRVIEDGPVRVVIEVLMRYRDSALCIHYRIPRHGTGIDVLIRAYWNEKDRALKLALPLAMPGRPAQPVQAAGQPGWTIPRGPSVRMHRYTAAGSTDLQQSGCTATPAQVHDHEQCRSTAKRLHRMRFVGQTAYGVADLAADGSEVVSQKWQAVVSDKDNLALTICNDGTYASDCDGRQLRLTLLRSPAYAAYPTNGEPLLAPDRFLPRTDQGEHLFRFRLDAGPADQRLAAVDRDALVLNEQPLALSMFPTGSSGKSAANVASAPPAQLPHESTERPPQRHEPAMPGGGVGSSLSLDDDVVQIPVVKPSLDGRCVVFRLFEPTGHERTTSVAWNGRTILAQVSLAPYELKTFRLDTGQFTCEETGLLEGLEKKPE